MSDQNVPSISLLTAVGRVPLKDSPKCKLVIIEKNLLLLMTSAFAAQLYLFSK